MLTIHMQTSFVQCIVAQLGYSMGKIAQLWVKSMGVQHRMYKVMQVCADDFYTSGSSILLRPRSRGAETLESCNVDRNQKEGKQ